MRTIATRHLLILLHGLILALLLVGLIERTGSLYLIDMCIYLLALVITHLVLLKVAPQELALPSWPRLSIRHFIIAVLLFQIVLLPVYWAALGNVPLWTALHEADDLRIVTIRREAGDGVPMWLNYAGHLQIKALAPMALLLAWTADRRLFWSLAVCAGVFAVSLLAKSFVITLFIPLWFALLIKRNWKPLLTLTGIFLALTVTLSWAANPQKFRSIDATPTGQPSVSIPEDEGVREHGLLGDAFLGVGKRLVLMPGHTVAAWFQHIPSDIPFAEGAAVRPLAVVLGQPYQDLSESIYALEYPEMAEKNVPGTMGTASFMYGYANFGRWGLLGSGVITALMLTVARLCFGPRWRWALVLSVFPLLSLTGGALPTVLLTHGWALALLLFLIIRPDHEPAA